MKENEIDHWNYSGGHQTSFQNLYDEQNDSINLKKS
jgi:hypothetical protein